jgi:hypothetical protein
MKKSLLIILAVILFGFGLYFWQKNDSASSKKTTEEMTSREVALACTTDMATEFHIHPELRIFIKGEVVLVPFDTGITNGCMNAIHTHSDRPILHVEAPVQKDFTLGDFFAVWDKPFNSMQILDFVATEEGQIRVTVNGQTSDSYENIILRDGDKMVIEVK